MTFNTRNPIGSTDARDRLDNTENMDYLENSTTELTHPDRLGTVRKTRHGMEAEHDAQISAHESEHDAQISAHEIEHDNQISAHESEFDIKMAGMAFSRVGTFTSGYSLTDSRQTLLYATDGHDYGWAGAFPKVVAAGATPATSGGIGAGAWVDRTDVALRSDINIVQKRYACVADMVADTTLTVGKIVETLSYYNTFVGNTTTPQGGNRYEIVPVGTGTIDAGSFIALSNGLQAKGLFINSTINVLQFGAKGDGVSDDTVAFEDALASGRGVYVPTGTYLLNALSIPSNSFLYGSGCDTIIKPFTNDIYCALGTDSGSSTTYKENITIRDIKFLGTVFENGFSEHSHLVSFNGVKNLLIDNCNFIGFRGDGIYIGSGVTAGFERHNINVTIRACFFDGINKDNRNGISVIDGDGVLIDGNYFTRCTRPNMPGAIDVEPDARPFHVVKNISVINNKFYNVGGNVGAVAIYLPDVSYVVPTQGFLIQGNHIENCNASGVTFNHSVVGGINDVTENTALKILNNTIKNSGRPFTIINAKDCKISNNSFITSSQDAILGYSTGNENNIDIDINNNTFYACGSTSGNGLAVFKCSRLNIHKNNFIDCGAGIAGAANAIDFNSGVSDHISIIGNIFVSPTGKTLNAIQKEALHTFTESSNTFINNSLIGLSSFFKAEYNDTSDSSYTPIVSGSTTSGTGTYAIQYGRWRRVGKHIFFKAKVTVNAGHTGTGIIQISLPTLVASADSNSETICSANVNGVTTTGGHYGLIYPALVVNGVGAIRCYMTQTGSSYNISIPAGSFTVHVAGHYTEN